MNPFSLIPLPYQLIAKGIASLALLLSLWWAWHAFTGHYIDIGKAETQDLWDKQTAIDAQVYIKDLESVRNKERADAEAKAKNDKHLIEVITNEKNTLDSKLAILRNDNRKLRTVTGQAITQPEIGKGETNTGGNAGCTVRLPDEIGTGFQELREFTFREASRANEIAARLNAANETIRQDRVTCNGQ